MFHERPRWAGNENLPPVPCRADPGGAVDVEPEIIVAAKRPLTGVDPHPHPKLDALGPVMIVDRTLGGHRSADRLRRCGEHGKERVALGADDDP